MQLFLFTEAEHFCRPLTAYVPGVGQSLDAFHRNLSVKRLREPNQDFETHRVSLLNSGGAVAPLWRRSLQKSA
jgi:hypothetical protein